MSEPIIHFDHVSRIYTMGHMEVPALLDVSLDVHEGEFVAIVGPSGSGKSTMMNILGCLDRPTDGTYRLAGTAVETLDDDGLAKLRSRTIGFVFQSYNLLPRTSALDNVATPLLYQGVKRSDRIRRSQAALERLGLGDRIFHEPTELSGGQQQRVAIARSLAMNPGVMLFDEVTAALDPETVKEVLVTIKDLAAEGMTCILVTHEMGFAREIADCIYFTDNGVIVEHGPPATFFDQATDCRTRQFLSQIL